IDPAIILASGQKHGRIRRPVLDMMVGRIRVKRAKLVGILDAAVLGGNEDSIGMIFKVHHVKQADMSNDGTKEIGALGQGRTHQETAVTSPFNGQPCRRSVAAIDKQLGAGKKVIEDILLVSQVSGTMPIFAVLAAPSQVGNGEPASAMEPYTSGDTEAGGLADAEPTITVKQNGIPPVQCGPFAVDDVKRHSSSVFGDRELADHFTVFKVDRRRAEHGGAI